MADRAAANISRGPSTYIDGGYEICVVCKTGVTAPHSWKDCALVSKREIAHVRSLYAQDVAYFQAKLKAAENRRRS